MKRILISNDDGYQARGITLLAEALRDQAEVTVVAPDRNRSGASNSLTLDDPIRAHTHENGVISVDGTPTDCVHLAITGLLKHEPDMVVSGINAGANLGDDVLYSGTVAAAMEGRFLGFPAIAVSLVGPSLLHYETAVKAVEHMLTHMRIESLSPDLILNVNVPDLHWGQINGFRATRLGHRHKSEPVIQDTDPRGRDIYWVGPPGDEQDSGPGTDFHAIREGYVSVTPLQIDLTRHSAVADVERWLAGVNIL